MKKSVKFRIRRDIQNKEGWEAWCEVMKVSFDHIFEAERETDGHYSWKGLSFRKVDVEVLGPLDKPLEEYM